MTEAAASANKLNTTAASQAIDLILQSNSAEYDYMNECELNDYGNFLQDDSYSFMSGDMKNPLEAVPSIDVDDEEIGSAEAAAAATTTKNKWEENELQRQQPREWLGQQKQSELLNRQPYSQPKKVHQQRDSKVVVSDDPPLCTISDSDDESFKTGIGANVAHSKKQASEQVSILDMDEGRIYSKATGGGIRQTYGEEHTFGQRSGSKKDLSRISSLHENVRLTLDLDSVLPDTPKACFVNDECCSLLQPEETNHLVHSKLRKPQKDMSKTRNATGIFTTEHGDPSATATTLKYPPPPPTPPQVPAYSHHANKRVPDRLLCVYICADPYCNTAVCRPADIRSELQDFDKIVKNPSFFFVPLPLIISREAEMRQAAKEANISIDRWNGSMLYRKWQEIEAKERDRQSRRGGNRKKHLQDEDDHSMITLHPVQNLAEAHMISPKIRWWHPWLTVSIRSFYNTGIIRVPGDCHGMEILLALEFFGILYTRQDQLVFDAPIVQQKVHHWSQYFAHRGRLAQWVAQKLRDEQEAQQKRAEHEQRRTGSPRRSFLPPLVFCTNPHTTKEGSIFTIDSHETPVAILEPTVDVADGLGDRKKDGTKDWMTSAKLVHDFFVPKIGSFGFDVEDALLCSPETIPSMMREDFSSYIQHILPDVEIAFLLKKICLVCTDFKQTREKEKFRYSETLQRAILIVAYNPLRSRRPSRDASAQEGPNPKALDTSMTSMKSIQSNQSRRSVDPPGSTARYLQPIDEPKKVPSVSTTSSSYSTSSSSSSVTAAPTDEMTFGKLISGAHKAVARLLDLKVEEKAMGHGLRHDDSFYFYKEDRGRNKLDSAADTSGTSDDSLLSIYADRAARLNARAGERVEVERVNEESPKWKPEQKKTLNKTSIDSESALPENQNGRIVPSSREESISVEHIYEDLYRESMFPELSVPETYNELISSASPMWTPSLMRAPNGLLGKQDTAQLPTSVLVQSSLDILSVTSSVTRACAKSILDEDAVTVEEKVTAGDRRDKKVSTTSKVKSTTQKLPGDDAHDREFAARFEALLNENGEPYDEARRQQQLKQQKKKKFNAALNDLKLGFGAQNSEAVGSGEILPTVADSELDECQFLNGIYDMFATDDKPTDIVLAPPSGSSGAKSSSKANSAQSVRSELSSGFSTEETIRSPRRSVVDVMGLSNDAIKSATKILTQLTESTTAVATSMGVDNGSPHNKQSQLSFVCGTGPNEASVSRKRLFVQPKRRVEDEVEAKHGIEVYHIAPAPSSQTPFDDSPLVTRNSQPKFLVASKSHFPRGPGRGGNRTSKSRSRCSNTGGNDAKSERKENKKFFQFLRKKK